MKFLTISASLLSTLFLLFISYVNSEDKGDINVTLWRLMERFSIPGEVIKLRSDMYNDGAKYMTILKWKTPLDVLETRPLSDIFKVEYSKCSDYRYKESQWCIIDNSAKNETLKYMGVRSKKGNPLKSSYKDLRPGSVTTENIDLTELFDFSRHGHYTIELDTNIIDGIRHWNNNHPLNNRVMANYTSNLEPINSNVVRFEIIDNKGFGRIDPVNPTVEPKLIPEYHYDISPRIDSDYTSFPKKWTLGELTFFKESCTPEQQEQIVGQLKEILNILEKISILPKDKFGEPLKRWFGNNEEKTREWALSNLKQISNLLTTSGASDKIEWHCGSEKSEKICTQDTFSFSSARFNQVTLCSRQFGNDTNTKYDTKLGIIVHEISHILLELRDIAATEKQCEKLTTKDKMKNANNFQFFFEDLVRMVQNKDFKPDKVEL